MATSKLANPPRLWWSIAIYHALLFLVGAVARHAGSYGSSLLDSLKVGLLFPILANTGFLAPFVVGDWILWVFTLSVIAGLIYACIRMTGWPRWTLVMSLMVGMHGYALYLVSRAAI